MAERSKASGIMQRSECSSPPGLLFFKIDKKISLSSKSVKYNVKSVEYNVKSVNLLLYQTIKYRLYITDFSQIR